jgi:hypothetical protein
VQASKLTQGGPEVRLEAHGLAVTREGVVRFEATFLQDLSETEQKTRPLALLIGQGRRLETLPVQPDQLVPFASKKVMLFERGEGYAVAAVGLEAFAVSIERRGHASLPGAPRPLSP